MEETDYKKLYEQEQKKVSVLEQKLALYEKDEEKSGYYALKKIANQQIATLQAFDFTTEIKTTTKDDKKYDRTKLVWEGLKQMLLDLRALKSEIGITKQDDAEAQAKGMLKPIRAYSPESIADSVGELAGKRS